MLERYSTGSIELDSLLDGLRPGDNVVFYTDVAEDALPFVRALCTASWDGPESLVYVRSSGFFGDIVAKAPRSLMIEVGNLAHDDIIAAMWSEAQDLGAEAFYLFDPLHSWTQFLPSGLNLADLFTRVCPFLFDVRSIAYWVLVRGKHSAEDLARIKDCTQVFLRVESDRTTGEFGGLVITPVKVIGRYADDMFRPHRVLTRGDDLTVLPLPLSSEGREVYVQALADKSRELAAANERLREQSRLYQSLRANLEHLQMLFEEGREISATLMVPQVHEAIVGAASRVFGAAACLCVESLGRPPELVKAGDMDWLSDDDREHINRLSREDDDAEELASSTIRAALLPSGGSAAVAPVRMRGTGRGRLQVVADDDRMISSEHQSLLEFLARESSIALDNAHLYQETVQQGEQLRSFIEDAMATEERESRRLAFDLHDGLVQTIVAAYQHLQAAQALRSRDPRSEAKESEEGVRLLRQAIYESRRLIAQLRPPGLDDFGLVAAVRMFASQQSDGGAWSVALNITPEWPSLPPELETALFRIVQEATNNAHKYSGADRAVVELSSDDEELTLSIRDGGQGFDPSMAHAGSPSSTGIGLVGIQERARHWGGRCQISTAPGQGTTVTVYIPRPVAGGEVSTID